MNSRIYGPFTSCFFVLVVVVNKWSVYVSSCPFYAFDAMLVSFYVVLRGIILHYTPVMVIRKASLLSPCGVFSQSIDMDELHVCFLCVE